MYFHCDFHFLGILGNWDALCAFAGCFSRNDKYHPYLGPYIGVLPALILAFSVSTKMVILVIIVCTVVQQVDGNLVYPNVIGKSLDIHPLTIIMLLLVAGNLAGLMGMILGIPTYAVLKVIVKYFHDIYLLNNEKNGQ